MQNIPQISRTSTMPVFQDIERRVGVAAALKLAAIFGGQRLSLPAPARMKADHRLAVAIGLNHARAVAGYFHERHGHGKRCAIPRGPQSSRDKTKLEAMRAISFGHPVSKIAAVFGISERTVRRYRAEMRANASLQSS